MILSDLQWLSVLPPLVAIGVVFWQKEVILALVLALLTAEGLLLWQQQGLLWQIPIAGTERLVTVAGEPGNLRILLFSVLIGGLLSLMRDSGGLSAMVQRLIHSGIATTPRRASGLTFMTGVVVFIESNLSVLTSGILARGLFDKFRLSRARLAYIIDSTSAPVCILVLLNGWGAFVLALLSQYDLPQSASSILWGTVPFNLYAWLTLGLVLYTILSGRTHGPMAQADREVRTAPSESTPIAATKARFMWLPLLTLVGSMLAFMCWTGQGQLAQGSGSRSVLYATVLALAVIYALLLLHRQMSHAEIVATAFRGMGDILPLVTIVLLSLALGASLQALGTGVFVAGIVGDYLPPSMVVPALFIAGAVISFTTGTSWGTFAILIPIGVPLIHSLGLPPSLVIAAILGGGIFGDHCSPISDTTAVSSLAAGCDLLTHVRTQLPYALAAGAVTLLGYWLLSLFSLGVNG